MFSIWLPLAGSYYSVGSSVFGEKNESKVIVG